ncbi:ATP-binding protein [Phosphitispora sp. TUW77]|uniref:ATP-binding protein n=1 Tax=Phosphitispora sp. TUW77 TaxID=3152361 RepID=UPI003AB2E820
MFITSAPTNENYDIGFTELLLRIGFTLCVSLIVTMVLLSGFWQVNPGLCQTAVELTYLFITTAVFWVVWYTYEKNSPSVNIMGLGFLIVTVLEILQIIYFLGLGIQPENFADMGIRYLAVSRTVQIIIIAVMVAPLKCKLNKWLGIAMALLTSFLLSYAMFHFPSVSPASAFAKSALYCIFIIGSLLTLVLIKNRPFGKDSLTYKYICLALIVVITSDLSLAIYGDEITFFLVFGHVTKIAYMYYLFKGIVENVLTHPYIKIESVNVHMSKIINGLPLGLMVFDADYSLAFANIKAEEIFGYNCNEVRESDELKELFARQFYVTNKSDNLNHKMVKVKNRQGADINLRVYQWALGEEGYIQLIIDAKKEQELENLHLQTQTVLNSMKNLFLLLDKNKYIVQCNKAFLQMIDLSEEDVWGMTLERFTALMQCTWREVLTEAGTEDKLNKMYEAILITSSGESKEVMFDLAPVYNVERVLVGYIALGIDVTRLKAEQLRLQQQEKLAVLGQMAAGIVHEIKNPLTAIKRFSQILKSQTTDERLRSYVNIIETEANGVNQVVSDFLSFARPRAPALKPISINNLITSLSLIIESQLFIKNVTLKMDIAKEERTVLADEDQLKQVIMNMVKNAIDAMANTIRPMLILSTKYNKKNGEMAMVLSDNGKGMSAEEISKIGTPFYTTKDAGTGLGLSVCLQIIKQHGGRIDVNAIAGSGSTFSIILPCIDNVI